MQFLQPIVLAGLPLAALPIIIHLINRQRHRTLRWAAMMFLLDARRMMRGMARLRYWLIMAMRMLAIAVLIFAISRPIMSGRLGFAIGGRPETTILVLDRSASMEQQDVQSRQSKRSTALRKLSDMIQSFGSGSRFVLIESTESTAREMVAADSLVDLPETTQTATSSDIPGMLQAALDYVVANQSGRTDIWICSDLRENDWKPDDGRWSAVRDGFAALPGVRFYLLSYPEQAGDNVKVRVTSARKRHIGRAPELVLDVELRRESDSHEPVSVPLEFVINGARSVLTMEMTGSESVLQGHSIALDETTMDGWGRIELPADGNPMDNRFYFVFAEPPEHRAVIVSEDSGVAELLRLAAVSPVDPALAYTAQVLTPDHAGEIDWGAASLVLWHGPLPDGVVARQMENFVQGGRPIICLPPANADSNELFGMRWQAWSETNDQPVRVASWRGDSDLLGHTQTARALPVGELRIDRHRAIAGAGNVLARLEGGAPLLTRAAAGGGPAYFLATLPLAGHSSLAQQGVVYYVLIQRALSLGATTQGKARHYPAGSQQAREIAAWTSLDGPHEGVLSSARPFHDGAFRNGDQLIALNRPAEEDASGTLDSRALGRLFSELDYRLVEDRVGDTDALASEVWRAFVCAMAVALLLEAWLCMPQRPAHAAEGTVG